MFRIFQDFQTWKHRASQMHRIENNMKLINLLKESIAVYLCNWQLGNMVLEEWHIFFIVFCFTDQVNLPTT